VVIFINIASDDCTSKDRGRELKKVILLPVQGNQECETCEEPLEGERGKSRWI
jgi:hypothetical protein